MNWINIFKIRLAALVVALMMAGGAAAQTVLKWGHIFETTEPLHTEAVWAAQEVERRTGGRYRIDVYPASQLGSESAINQGLTLGAIDITISGSSYAARSFPRLGVTYYPYTFRGPEHLLAYTQSDIYQELTRGYEEKTGNRIVSATYYGARHSTSNRPFSRCAEMKGLKMRIPDSVLMSAMPRACGANPAPIAFAEVYLALQNGTVDAQENPLATIESKRFYEVQKHLVLTGHIIDHLITTVSGHLWRRLSTEDRRVFTEVLQEAARRTTVLMVARERDMLDLFRARGLTVTEVDTEEFRQAVLTNIAFEPLGYHRADWERIQAVSER